MATFTQERLNSSKDAYLLAQYTITTNESTTPITFLDYIDNCVQVTGSFGGGMLVVEGSNDGSNWSTMHSLIGADLSFTASGIAQISERPVYMRVTLTGATSPNVVVSFLLRRAS